MTFSRKGLPVEGQAFQPDRERVRLESLTYEAVGR
jgi:hypothetical protein